MKHSNKQYEYFRMKLMHAAQRLKFQSLKEMTRYAEFYHVRSIFILTDEKKQAKAFAISHDGDLLEHETAGFETLEDYTTCTQQGFPDAHTFYKATGLGFRKFDEYKMTTEAGITDAAAYDKVKTEGYIEAFKQLEKQRAENSALPSLAEITNAFQLQKWVEEKEFENVQQFMSGWQRGFTDRTEMLAAESKGYERYDDYRAGIESGYLHSTDYFFAKEKGIASRDELTKYIDLESVHHADGLAHDQLVFLILLSKLGDGKKTSINRLYEIWEKDIAGYYRPDGILPPWFTRAISNREELVKFLIEQEDIKKYGHYDKDGEYFDKKELKDRSVILDGSNVAHGRTGTKSKPLVHNIELMVRFLKEKGFTDITVFTDAALKHRLQDQERLSELKKLCTYMETPAETDADLFLISYVKRKHCLIVSNDTFREWKMHDPWVAENIDFYRLTFMIEGEEVIMPDVK